LERECEKRLRLAAALEGFESALKRLLGRILTYVRVAPRAVVEVAEQLTIGQVLPLLALLA